MNRRERLMATLRGEPVDRPPVSFYEVGGFPIDPNNTDPFNVYNDPSWKPLLDLAEEQTDLMRMVAPGASPLPGGDDLPATRTHQYMENGSRFTRYTLEVGGRVLTSLTRRDPDVNTVWTLEHMLKDVDDLKAYLQLPDEYGLVDADVSSLFAAEKALGDKGIVQVETADPICVAASLFSMEDYTIIALTEQSLFHALLEKVSASLYRVVEQAAAEFPGHLWRIAGPEYAGEPYLPPRLFEEYVVRYTKPIVQAITKHGGFARIHCHGRLKNILHYFVEMGASGTDPIEPPPQGDVELADVRREYGRDLVLFGNLEASDIENAHPDEFEKTVAKALRDGTAGEGKGFVLMPSSSPYGRVLSDRALENYRTMVRLAQAFGG